MHNRTTSRVHGKHDHDENSTFISEFPELKNHKTLYRPALSPYDQARIDLMIKSQNKEEYTKKHCYKLCMRLHNSKYIEYCLKQKCNATLKEASEALGLLK